MAGLFGLSNYDKPGKGIEKEDLEKKGIALYFDIFFRRLRKICSLNLFYIAFSIPALIVAWFICNGLLLLLASSAEIDLNVYTPYLKILSLFAVVLWMVMCGSGPASVALHYVLRKYVNDSHSWPWSDFVEQTKKNFKQGLQLYLINTLVTFMLVFAYIFYATMPGNPIQGIISIVLLIFFAIFAVMQLYTYQLACSVELKTRHIYRNAFILAFLGIGWNIAAVAVVGGIIYLMFKLALVIPFLGLILCVLMLFGIVCFTQIFITNKVVKKYVILPALNQSSDGPQKEDFDSDFED